MFFTNVQKANIIDFVKTIFLAPILAVKNTLFTFFFAFFPPCMPFFFQKKLSSNSWGVKKAPCKNLYVFGENWQRNQFPKLTTLWLLFSLMLQLCHSAMFLNLQGEPNGPFDAERLWNLLLIEELPTKTHGGSPASQPPTYTAVCIRRSNPPTNTRQDYYGWPTIPPTHSWPTTRMPVITDTTADRPIN